MNNVLQSIRDRAISNRTLNISQKDRKFSQENGGNNFEKKLALILREHFSNYITYINPFKKKGEELCDALLIINNDIIIFSDKGSDNFNNNIDDQEILMKKWKNFYQGIKNSEKQLSNAKNWISENIKNNELCFFLNQECNEFCKILFTEEPNFYFVTTISGLTETAKKIFKNDGVLPIDHSEIISNKKLFSTINKQDDNNFFHTFDIETLKQLMDYINTPTDFIQYLNYRFNFFTNNLNIKCEREDQILFLYVIKDCNYKLILDTNITEIDFLNKNPNSYQMLFDKNQYIEFNDRLKYNENSKIIDDLFDNFCYQGNKSNSFQGLVNDSEEKYRQNMYSLLSLNRRERIALALDIEEVLNLALHEKQPKSSIVSKEFRGILFIVCAFYRLPNENPVTYTARRANSMEWTALKNLQDGKLNNKKALFLWLDNPRCEQTSAEAYLVYDMSK